jgi:hypothetical protein
MPAEAIAEMEKADKLEKHGSTNTIASLVHTYAIARDKSKAQQILSELNVRYKYQPISHHQFAVIFTGLSDKVRRLDKVFRENLL